MVWGHILFRKTIVATGDKVCNSVGSNNTQTGSFTFQVTQKIYKINIFITCQNLYNLFYQEGGICPGVPVWTAVCGQDLTGTAGESWRTPWEFPERFEGT